MGEKEIILEIENILDELFDDREKLEEEINGNQNIDEEKLIEYYYNKLKSFYLNSNSNVKRHKYSKISEWLINKWRSSNSSADINNSIDTILSVIEYMKNEENICDNEAVKKSLEKLIDHIELEKNRLNYSDLRYEETKKLMKEVSKLKEIAKKLDEIDKEVKNFDTEIKNNINKIDKKVKNFDTEIKNNKFDLIALTTLIFTAFTMISLNATIITAIIQAKTNYILGQIILAIIIVNAIVLSSVFLIYSIIRKIHGDIENAELYRICIFIAFIYITAMLIVVKSKMLNIVILPK